LMRASGQFYVNLCTRMTSESLHTKLLTGSWTV
jgi:hypothetical protein